MTSNVSLLARIQRYATHAAAAMVALAVLALLAAPSAEAARHRKHPSHSHRSVAETHRAPYLGRHVSSRRHASRHRNVRVASLGTDTYTRRSNRRPSRSVASTGHNVVWQASSGCLNGTLRAIVAEISSMASVRVNSTCRSKSHNRAVGGAHRSMHLSGDAVDFRVLSGNTGAVYAYLRSNSSVGGLKHYGGGLFHVDTGARRTW